MKLFLLFILFFATLQADEQKDILLLHSYNKGLKWSDGISEGINDVMMQHRDYELTTEYMDSKKIDTQEYFDSLLNLYKQKFLNRKYKAIIVADNYAYNFVLSNYEDLFNGIPVVFCGVEHFDKENIPIKLQNYFTGVVEYKRVRENLNLIKKIIPNINTLYIISDDSFSSLAIKQQILTAAKEFKNEFKIIYDNDIDITTIESKINSLPTNSAVLFTSLYKDKFGRYIPYDRLRTLFKTSKYPFFALTKIHLGEGVLGGVMVDPYEQGFLAAQKVFEIIGGKNPLQVEVSIPMAKYYFDYHVIEKFSFDRLKIPFKSMIINKPKSFFEKNRKIVDSAFVMMPILVLLIIILIINVFKQIRLEGKLVEQGILDSVLLNNIKSAIFWKSKDDILLGCNDSLCTMLELSKNEIIGKHIKDIMPEICKIMSSHNTFIDEMETKLMRTTKTPIEVLIRRKKYFNKRNEEAGVVTVISDITSLRMLELQRKKDEQFIIQRSKLSEIGEMLTSIAHQWKAPLVEISVIVQELLYKKNKVENKKEDTKLFVNEIMEQVEYMSKTIDDFRAFIKPSTKQVKFNVKQAIDELLKIVEHSLKHSYINVTVTCTENDIYDTYGYQNEFKQSILNIINNAKYSILERQKTDDTQGEILIDISNNATLISITIKDNGIGIKESSLESIFEPFVTSREDGDGFGLYMAKLIIEDKMFGKIQALKCDNGAIILIGVKKS